MGESDTRVFLGVTFMLMIVGPLCQIVGFFSPAWACIPEFNATDCEPDGLFYPNGLLGEDIFYLCLTSMVGSVLLAISCVILACRKRSWQDILDSGLTKVTAFLFYVFQFLSGIAFIICKLSHFELFWSAYLFVLDGSNRDTCSNRSHVCSRQ